MLLLYGKELTPDTWEVIEKNPTIFVRAYFVYGGEVIYKDKNKEVFLKPSHLYFFPTTKPYTLKQNKKDKLSCLFMHYGISPFIIDDIIELNFEKSEFLSGINSAMTLPAEKHYNENSALIFTPLADALISYLKLENLIKINNSPVVNALELIAGNPKVNFTIEELSKCCGYNSQYFVKLFKKHMEVSPHQYIVNYKMQLAIKFLQNGFSVSKTAEKLGFSELRSFSRCFKNQFGISPSHIKNHIYFMP